MLAPLTTTQLEILRFIRDWIESTGCSPSLREIGRRFEINNPQSVARQLQVLERKGCIERSRGLQRAIKLLVDPGRSPEIRVLETIYALTIDNCEAPTMQELADELNSTPTELIRVLSKLRSKNLVTWDPNTPRSFRINQDCMAVTFDI